jgi:LacI family transcriptional regulator
MRYFTVMAENDTQRPGTRRSSGGPTISHVAALAGVSLMTVSRVINDETKVRPKTRDAVKAAILELGYAPNPAARSLAGAAQTRIALLYSNPSAAYLTEVLVGSLRQASRSDALLIVDKSEPDEAPLNAIQHLIERGVDGVILPPPLCDSPTIVQLLHDANVPVALIASGAPDVKAISVSIDDKSAAREMTRYLLHLGHRRIAFIVGDPLQTTSDLRLAGYQAALTEAGVPGDPALIARGDFSYRSGLAAAKQLLALVPPPSAIFASNDDMAAAAVAMAHRHGLDVPRDLTVCGFDDTSLATTIWPELTTIRQPIVEMAELAAELLIATIRGRDGQTQPAQRVLSHQLIRRGSDAPLPT